MVRMAGIVVATLAWCGQLAAQAAPPYDGIQAGLDAFRLAEEQRQTAAAAQVGLSTQLTYWPPSAVIIGLPDLLVFPPLSERGTNWIAPVRQPIGQMQRQTGPRRWESVPVYDPPPAPLLPLPLVASPLLDNTSYAPLQAAPPPPAPDLPPPPPAPPAKSRGPREY